MKNTLFDRRSFLHALGSSSAALPFLTGLPGLQAAPKQQAKRVIFVFTPNGTIPDEFWPDQQGEQAGDLKLKRILKPLEPWRDRIAPLRGICNRLQGDGDRHMRGMSCLLTGTELLPGNIQGGGGVPAGWAGGISLDQELKRVFQAQADTRTQFGSLEFGVAVPNRADPWTRMSYAGANQPIAPVSDPKVMMERLYGQVQDRENMEPVVGNVRAELLKLSQQLPERDRMMLQKHLSLVTEVERELQHADTSAELAHPMPDVDPDIELVNDNTPEISRMQIDLLVNSLANDMSRVATLQYMRSVGQARMSWLEIEEGHHGLSHEPDNNKQAREKLVRINQWFAGEIAYLAQELQRTADPTGGGSLLDHTLVVWMNELGKGNNHTLDDIPFVLIGGEKATNFEMGRVRQFPKHTPHNRLWLSIAHAMGHEVEHFGDAPLCAGGALDLRSV